MAPQMPQQQLASAVALEGHFRAPNTYVGRVKITLELTESRGLTDFAELVRWSATTTVAGEALDRSCLL